MKLQEFYDSIRSLTPGTEIEHDGYTLKKVSSDGNVISSPDHSEVFILNQNDVHVETYTLDAFSSFQEFVKKFDELREYNPDSISDWLNRPK